MEVAVPVTGHVAPVDPEHIDRQPPRDAEEEAEQEELMRGGAAESVTEAPTDAPADDLGPSDEG